MNALQTQTTQPAPKRIVTESTIKSANQTSVKRGARLFSKEAGYTAEQIDATTVHVYRPLSVILAETTESFLKGGNGRDVIRFYTVCTARLESEGVVECGCPGYDNYKQCCAHSEAIKQAYAAALSTEDVDPFDARFDPGFTEPVKHAANCDCQDCFADEDGVPHYVNAMPQFQTMRAIEAAPVVPVTSMPSEPIEESLPKCACGAPVWVAAYRTYKRCYKCQHKAEWG